jgi:predicted ATP-grasp superfamily ATP-dependent carboligase
MRILVHEFVTGGGFAGREVPASLGREGAVMRAALVTDLAAIGRHEIVTTAEHRFPMTAQRGVEVVTLRTQRGAPLDALMASVDAIWLVAPETSGRLERLAKRAEGTGKLLLGSGAAAIRRASDKARLARRLKRYGVAHPITRCLRHSAEWRTVVQEIGYPVVVKPGRGAGCEGVSLARNARQLRDALDMARRATRRAPLLLQRYVQGVPASVSLLADGRRAMALTVNGQSIGRSGVFSYRGGTTPLDHALAHDAVDEALRACGAMSGLRGYVGVDLVLTKTGAVVIEVNPRLTTAYLGVRAALDANIAELTLAACQGALPDSVPVRRRVRFTASGRIMSRVSYLSEGTSP